MTGPFGGDNIPDNFTVETYNGSAAARGVQRDRWRFENGSGAVKRWLTDGSDTGEGSTLGSETGVDGLD